MSTRPALVDYEYQKTAVTDIINSIAAKLTTRTMLVMPTGTGKTVVSQLLITDERLQTVLSRNTERKTKRIVYKVHLHRLATQARRRFEKFGIQESTMQNWLNPEYSTDSAVEVCYQMYSEKIPKDADIDMIIIDECQHEACTTVQEFLLEGGNYPIIGLTATPDRPDNVLLKFDVIVEPITRQEAVDNQFICETDIITIVDTATKNKMSMLVDVLAKFNIEMKQTMIFVRTKKEINIVAEYINNVLGEKAVGLNDDDDIDNVLDSFGRKEFKYLVSCRKLGEGVDVPGVTDVVFARNIGSMVELNQYIGRAARIDVMECRVWEFVNALSSTNIDSTEVVGIPKSHRIVNRVNGELLVRNFM